MDGFRYEITQHLIPSPSRRRRGVLMNPGVRFLVAHDTGNPGSSAMQNARYFASTPNPPLDKISSAHLFVDDRQIVESVPAISMAEKASHVLKNLAGDNQLYGYDANDAAIGIEYCYGSQINSDEAYRRYVHVLAWLCRRYELDPGRHITGHFILDPRRRSDPVTGLAHSRRSYEQLLRDVAAEFVGSGGSMPAASPLPANGQQYAATVRLNLRSGKPSRLAPISRTVQPGALLDAVGADAHGESVAGQSLWLRTDADEWFWAGGVRLV